MGQMGEDIADWKYFLSIISKCTDDYLYIYDLSDDYAIYSSSITKDFELDVAEFSNAGRKLKDVIYPDDYEAVFNNISELQNGHISCHNMEYRWKSRKNGYVFISCRGQLVRRNGINYMIGRVSEIGKKNRYDNVTGIYTDLILEDRYDDIVKSDGHTGCIMQIGIDNFKEINEKYGTKTEAMSVVDVNSGKNVTKAKKEADKENNILKTNIEAGIEIIRQLRLRNISGIIIIDFINMAQQESRDKLLSVLKEYARLESIQTNVVDITPLGLVEMTRKNNGKTLKELIKTGE